MPRPLLLTADPLLLDDLLRLAAAGGAEPDVADHARAAAALWRDAPLVVVGADRAPDAAAAGLPRRPGLVLAGRDPGDADVWRHAVALGAEHVTFLPDAEPWLVDRFADATGAGRALTVACVGARGGAGATSFAVALALAGGRAGHRTMLVDLDPYGGGIDLALGAENVAGPRWDTFADAAALVSGEALADVLPRCGEVIVLAWPRTGTARIRRELVEPSLLAARRAAGLLVLDLPRSFDEAARVALATADVAVVVCPAEVRACSAGRRIAEAVSPLVDDVRLVVRGPAPTHLSAEQVASSVGVPLLGWLDPEPGIAAGLDRGRAPGRGGRGPLAALCRSFLADVLGRAGEVPA